MSAVRQFIEDRLMPTPKGQCPVVMHGWGNDHKALCGRWKPINATHDPGRVTCHKCIGKRGGA